MINIICQSCNASINFKKKVQHIKCKCYNIKLECIRYLTSHVIRNLCYNGDFYELTIYNTSKKVFLSKSIGYNYTFLLVDSYDNINIEKLNNLKDNEIVKYLLKLSSIK